jgi:hypothetical protein
MKKFANLHLILILLVPLFLDAQTWQYSHDFYPSSPQESYFIGDSMFLVSIENHHDNFPNTDLCAFDFQGNLKWKTTGGQLTDIHDDTLYAVNYSLIAGGHDCYYIAELFKLDLHGNILSNTTIDHCSTPYELPLQSIDVGNKERILLTSPSSLIQISPKINGWKNILHTEQVVGAYYMDATDSLTLCAILPNRILHLTEDYDTLYIGELDFTVKSFLLYQDSLYLLSDGNSIYHMHNYTAIPQDTLHIQKSGDVVNFRIQDELLWISSMENEQEILRSYDLFNGQPVDSLIINAYFLPINTNYFTKERRLFITGENNFRLCGIFSYPLDSIADLSFPDISISDMVIDITEIRPHGEGAPLAYSDVYFNLSFTIENKGNEPVEHFILSTNLAIGYSFEWVHYSDFQWTPENVYLETGQTVQLEWNGLKQVGPENGVCVNIFRQIKE